MPQDEALDFALRRNAEAALPPHDVAPNQGKLLHLLARMGSARRILEIGTLGGYSTIWLARALPMDGRLVTLELDPERAELARGNLERAGVGHLVEIRCGPAVESLASMSASGEPPFDMIFIDADKPSNPAYLEWSLRLSRPGTVIVCDNVVRDGAVIDRESEDPNVAGIRRFFEMMSSDPRLDATAIQTVGSKGHDGFVLAVVRD